ncbi:hypothetical protein AALP_AA7G089700 [Arabis alpina]|uniref:Cysteine-rich transmembrane domain-containing protein n=1 Tax=Arabis alpina TaxID=50452 RepID=A0A087GGV2_ARAAL|nr:hypothetical protein AALP_AA7G089700 [Arabis alpina]
MFFDSLLFSSRRSIEPEKFLNIDQGYPPEGYPKDQGYPPQGYPQQGYPKQGYPPPYAPQYLPPLQHHQQQQSSPGFLEGCLDALCCCCLLDACF